jgi:hypothetical protein
MADLISSVVVIYYHNLPTRTALATCTLYPDVRLFIAFTLTPPDQPLQIFQGFLHGRPETR